MTVLETVHGFLTWTPERSVSHFSFFIGPGCFKIQVVVQRWSLDDKKIHNRIE
jgi:hypothetical protein